MTPADWKIAQAGHTVNVYDPSGRRLLSVVEVGDGLVVRTHRLGVVPISVVAEAIARAQGARDGGEG